MKGIQMCDKLQESEYLIWMCALKVLNGISRHGREYKLSTLLMMTWDLYLTSQCSVQGLLKGAKLCLNPSFLAGWRSELAGRRSTLSMSKIKVKISETKYRSFYKTLDKTLPFDKTLLFDKTLPFDKNMEVWNGNSVPNRSGNFHMQTMN